MKKKISMFLSATMLLPLFAGCFAHNEDGKDTVSTKLPNNYMYLDVSQYKIIYPQKTTDLLLNASANLKNQINSHAGCNIGYENDWIKPGTDDSAIHATKEILVGSTNRTQTSEVLAKIEGLAYTIELVDNKIVIIGSSDAATVEAIDYFISTYVTKSSGNGKLPVEKNLCYMSGSTSIVNLFNSGKFNYKMVLPANADQQVVKLVNDVCIAASNITGVSESYSIDTTKSDYEILIGDCDRTEVSQAKSGWNATEYGIEVIGNKIVVNGMNETTIKLAVSEFIMLMEASSKTEKDGSKSISFRAVNRVKTNVDWIVDIPEYKSGTLSDYFDCGDNALQQYITGTNASEYKTYCNLLDSKGYKLYCKNEISGNLYATYTKDKTLVNVYYVDYLKAVRIITEPVSTLPPQDGGSYKKITESSVTQMKLNYTAGNIGNAYIITLEDGSFIIIDGGGKVGNDHIRLYNLIKELNVRSDGKIVIAAWIITHDHQDHYAVFDQFTTTYSKDVTLELFINNDPCHNVKQNAGNSDFYLDEKLQNALKNYSGVKVLKAHTGQKICIRNAEFEVLYTHEDHYPQKIRWLNNASLVTRMTINGQTVMWLADVETDASKVICNMYGSYLKSDIVQMAHHGSSGQSKDLYTLINPSVILWPHSEVRYKQMTTMYGQDSYYLVNHYVVNELNVKEIIVADNYNKTIRLPYVANSRTIINIP